MRARAGPGALGWGTEGSGGNAGLGLGPVLGPLSLRAVPALRPRPRPPARIRHFLPLAPPWVNPRPASSAASFRPRAPRWRTRRWALRGARGITPG